MINWILIIKKIKIDLFDLLKAYFAYKIFVRNTLFNSLKNMLMEIEEWLSLGPV
jgi:hypothetical protein